MPALTWRHDFEPPARKGCSYLASSVLAKDAHLIFMCRSGSTRSAPAADALYELGYANVYSMVDGFEGGKAKTGQHQGARVVNGWKNSGLPWSYKLNPEKIYLRGTAFTQ